MLRTASAILTILAVTASGCATIVDGSSQPVTFNSEPNRAKIFLNGTQVGVTPLTLQVQRSKTTVVVAKKEGYEEQQIPLQTKLNGYFWGIFSPAAFWVRPSTTRRVPALTKRGPQFLPSSRPRTLCTGSRNLHINLGIAMV
jgi:hypothetical protein